jgi:hypothetical protein
MRIKSGAQIPIEERPAEEISNGLGWKTAPDGSDIYNPAFDVTPAELVGAIITEKGVVKAPYSKALSQLFEESTGRLRRAQSSRKVPVAQKAKKAKRKVKPKPAAKARSKQVARG